MGHMKNATLKCIAIVFLCNALIAVCDKSSTNNADHEDYEEDIHELAKRYEKRTKRRKDEEVEDRKRRLNDRESTTALNSIAKRLDNMTNLISTLFRKYSRRDPPNYPDPVGVKIGVFIKGESLTLSLKQFRCSRRMIFTTLCCLTVQQNYEGVSKTKFLFAMATSGLVASGPNLVPVQLRWECSSAPCEP